MKQTAYIKTYSTAQIMLHIRCVFPDSKPNLNLRQQIMFA